MASATSRRASSEKFIKTPHESFAHATKLDKPAVIGRGTSVDQVNDLHGENDKNDTKARIAWLIHGYYTRTVLAPNAHMATIPLSLTPPP